MINILKKIYGYLPAPIQSVILITIGFKGNISPSQVFLMRLDELLKNKMGSVRIAEVGADRGATSIEVAKRLGKGDVFDIFDRKSAMIFNNKNLVTATSLANIKFHSNSNKMLDSYAWNLAVMYKDWISSDPKTGIWD